MTFALVRQPRLGLESFCRATGMHPDLVRRLVALGLLEAVRAGPGLTDLWFAPGEVAAAARIQRLRTGLGLNYAAVGLVVDLLDRIAELEAALRVSASRRPGRVSASRPAGQAPATPKTGGRSPWT